MHGRPALPKKSGTASAGLGEDKKVTEKPKIHTYKSVCAKLGLIMCVFFVCRILSGYFTPWLVSQAERMDETAFYLNHAVTMVLLIYVIPLVVTMAVFKSFSQYGGKWRALYQKPRRLARALGSFPAMYGMGYGTALLTLLVMFIISRVTGGQTFIEDLFRPTVMEPSTNIVNVLATVFMLVVIAPVVEEFWMRGVVYDALKPYGAGMAIIISSVLFGLMHGSMYMLFYTTALGFALGYVRYATGSLFAVTVLHALVNAVAAGILLMSSLTELTNEESKLINTFYNIYMLAVLILIIVGVIVFIVKIPVIKKYKIENGWDEIGAGRKTALFFASIPVIIMLILALNEHTHNWLLDLLI
jgi:membrane protease YdiL (CAAX protease family)